MAGHRIGASSQPEPGPRNEDVGAAGADARFVEIPEPIDFTGDARDSRVGIQHPIGDRRERVVGRDDVKPGAASDGPHAEVRRLAGPCSARCDCSVPGAGPVRRGRACRDRRLVRRCAGLRPGHVGGRLLRAPRIRAPVRVRVGSSPASGLARLVLRRDACGAASTTCGASTSAGSVDSGGVAAGSGEGEPGVSGAAGGGASGTAAGVSGASGVASGLG